MKLNFQLTKHITKEKWFKPCFTCQHFVVAPNWSRGCTLESKDPGNIQFLPCYTNSGNFLEDMYNKNYICGLKKL